MIDKKSKKMSEEFVKRAIIKWLSKNEWGTNLEFGGLRDPGVDIKVKHNRYNRWFFIEAKKEGKIPQADENAFVNSLGQIVTRMKHSGSTRNYYGLGLPTPSARIAMRRLPWQVAKKLLLFVFSVSSDGKVKQYSWQDLKERQTKK